MSPDRFMLVMATLMPLEAASFRLGMEASWLKGAMAMPFTPLCDVGLDQLGLFGLVVVGVGSQDLDPILGAGIRVALDHALHELVILEYHTRDDKVCSRVYQLCFRKLSTAYQG